MLVELVDYQCPACRQVEADYREVLENATANYASRFEFLRVDFPLEYECNSNRPDRVSGGPHPAACEAAAAVRLAREAKGQAEEARVIEWLWSHQEMLTPQVIFEGALAEFGLDLRTQFPRLRTEISADTARARLVGIAGTPTFFLNGHRLGPLPAEAMAQAIQVEIDRAIDGIR